MVERAPRTRRAGKVQVRATDRLLAGLLALRALGAATTADLTLLLNFPTRNSANKWLRRVYDAGLVRAHVEDLAADNAYTLTREGWKYLITHLDAPVEFGTFSPVEPTPHRLLRARLWSLVAVALGQAGGALRAWPEEALRPLGSPVVPDLLLEVGQGRGTQTIAVESDTGSESPAQLRVKLSRYADLRGQLLGRRLHRVVWVVPDEARVRTLERAIRDAPSGGLHRALAADALTVERILTDILLGDHSQRP